MPAGTHSPSTTDKPSGESNKVRYKLLFYAFLPDVPDAIINSNHKQRIVCLKQDKINHSFFIANLNESHVFPQQKAKERTEILLSIALWDAYYLIAMIQLTQSTLAR